MTLNVDLYVRKREGEYQEYVVVVTGEFLIGTDRERVPFKYYVRHRRCALTLVRSIDEAVVDESRLLVEYITRNARMSKTGSARCIDTRAFCLKRFSMTYLRKVSTTEVARLRKTISGRERKLISIAIPRERIPKICSIIFLKRLDIDFEAWRIDFTIVYINSGTVQIYISCRVFAGWCDWIIYLINSNYIILKHENCCK